VPNRAEFVFFLRRVSKKREVGNFPSPSSIAIMSSGEAELNALCNLLDEISDDEDSKGEEQVQSGQDHVDAQLAEALDQPFEDKGEAVEDEEAATHDYDIEEEEDAMEKQLRLMQEQMDEMQKKIAEKKQKGKGKDEQKVIRRKRKGTKERKNIKFMSPVLGRQKQSRKEGLRSRPLLQSLVEHEFGSVQGADFTGQNEPVRRGR
jgi:hypothetical protein